MSVSLLGDLSSGAPASLEGCNVLACHRVFQYPSADLWRSLLEHWNNTLDHNNAESLGTIIIAGRAEINEGFKDHAIEC